MGKAIPSLRLATAGLAVFFAVLLADSFGQAVDPQPVSFAPDERAAILVDYTLSHHGPLHWPRHKPVRLAGFQ